MAQQRNRQDRNPHGKRARRDQPLPSDFQATPRIQRSTKPLEPQTHAQAAYLNAIEVYDLVFCMGPAGTGKTYVAGMLAGLALRDKAINKIILTRPAVEAGENLGFLPGELEEKYEPYLTPFKDVLCDALGKSMYDYCLKVGKIEPAPLAYMRGRTFKNCIVILDEAQNVTPVQMKMFLTRIGENCTVIVSGDLKQKDIAGTSGLADAIERLKDVRQAAHVEFNTEDVVRSGFVQRVIVAYES